MLRVKASKLHSASSSVFERAVGWNAIKSLARRILDCTTLYLRWRNRQEQMSAGQAEQRAEDY
jgi:hypothetical protein